MRPQHFKPCPFCGAKIQIQNSFGGHEYFYHLHLSEESCSAQRSKCILDGKHFALAYEQGVYVAQWNNRPLESSLQAENRRLREALQEIANGDGTYGAQAFEYKQIARKALEATNEK